MAETYTEVKNALLASGVFATPASVPTLDFTPTWVKYHVAYTDFQVAAMNHTALLDFFANDKIITGIIIDPIQSFSGGGLSSVTLSVGNNTSLTAYCPAKNVFTGALTAGNTTSPEKAMYEGVLNAEMIGDVNLNALTQGSANIYVCICKHP